MIRTGNSLAVVIPAQYIKQVGIKQGDHVEISLKPREGQIVYTFLNVRQLSLV